MKTKKQKLKTRQTAVNPGKVRPETPAPESSKDDMPDNADYGGLPQRDLKKNLGGCG